MASVKDTFNGVISEAIKTADLISDNYQKAMAMGTIAQALAIWNNGGTKTVATEVTEAKEEIKPKAKKTADKLKRQPKELPPEEEEKKEEAAAEEAEAEEVPAEETAAEESQGDFTEEWTDEAVTAFAEELQYITDFTEKYGEEGANECLVEFSQGVMTDITSDVNPLNIKGIVAAFRKFEADAESAA